MNTSDYKQSQLKYLASLIGFKTEKVQAILENIDTFYKEKKELKLDKLTGKQKKYPDGTPKFRVIRPSYRDLKFLQKQIKDKILAPIPLPNNIHGGVKKKSNITNAKSHQGKRHQFTVDLQDFYPSISSQNVYDTFLKLGFSNVFANYLTKLTTWKHELPQGTPTSTHISNLFFLKTDYLLIDFCAKHSITYTRYVDDLTFSSPKCFKHLTQEILDIVKNSSGLKLSYRKINYGGKQLVTGIYAYNNKIDAPERIIQLAALEATNPESNKSYTLYLNQIRQTNLKNINQRSRKVYTTNQKA